MSPNTLCSKCVFEIKNKTTGEYECKFTNRLDLLAQNGALVDLDKRGHHIIRNRECEFFRDRAGKKPGKKKVDQLEQEILNQDFTWNVFIADLEGGLNDGVSFALVVLDELKNRDCIKSIQVVTDDVSKYLANFGALINNNKQVSIVDIGNSENKLFDFNVALNTSIKKHMPDYYMILEDDSMDDTTGFLNYIIDRFTYQVRYNCKRIAATRSKEESFGIFNTSVHFALGGLFQMNDTELVNFLIEEGKLPKACMPLWEDLDEIS